MFEDCYVTTPDIDYIFARSGIVENAYFLTLNADIKEKRVELSNHVVVYPIKDMVGMVMWGGFFNESHEYATYKAMDVEGNEIECVTFLPEIGVYSKLWIAIVSGFTGEHVSYKMRTRGIKALSLDYTGMKQKYTAYTCDDANKVYDMGVIVKCDSSAETSSTEEKKRKTVIYCYGVDEADAERQYNERTKLCAVNGWSYDEVVKDVGDINGLMDLMVRSLNGDIEKICTNQESIAFCDDGLDIKNCACPVEAYCSSDFDAADRTIVETLKKYVGYMAGFVEGLEDVFNDKSRITVTKGKKKNVDMHKAKVHCK